MNRVKLAIKHNRCVLAINAALTQRNEVLKEINSRSIPAVTLGAEANGPIKEISTENLTPAFTSNGLVVMVEPDFSSESVQQLAAMVKQANPRPQLCVVAKSFNRFALPLSVRLLNIHHVKMRGDLFIAALPEEEEAKPVKKEKAPSLAPSSVFIGRQEELSQLSSFLETPGRPILLSGPAGIGKRWLLEKALANTSYKRLPDLHLDKYFGGDALLGRIAVAAASNEEKALQRALSSRGKRPAPKQLIELALSTVQSDKMADHLLVVSGLESLLDHRDLSFYKENLLELTIQALMATEIKMKIVFLSERNITIYHADKRPRHLSLEGLTAADVQSFYEAWRVPEDQQEQALALFDRTHGHPMALRHVAISLRNGQTAEQLLENSRGAIDAISDIPKVRKTLRKSFDRLSADEKQALHHLTLFRVPMDVQYLQELQINRKIRLRLLSEGLLEQTPQQSSRRYYVHPLSKSLFRRGVDFEIMRELGLSRLDMAKIARKKQRFNDELYHIQEANALLVQSHRGAKSWTTSVPFCDPIVQSIRELIFPARKNDNASGKKKKQDRAHSTLKSGFYQAPNHSGLLLLQLLLHKKEGAKRNQLLDQFAHIEKVAATPESYHMEASFHLERNSTVAAMTSLQNGIANFPENGRMQRRLASLMIRQNQLQEAITVLEGAIEAQPLMPDNHSIIGDIYTRMGQDFWDKAEAAFARSKELGQANVPHLVREANLLRAKALVDLKNKDSLLQQAETCLQQALEQEENNFNAQISLATVFLDSDRNLEQVADLLKPSLKRRDKADSLIQYARLQIRNKEFDKVNSLLDSAYKLANNNHYAFAVRGEYFYATGDIFRSLQAFNTALERAPETAPERVMYEHNIAKMKAIIESGQISELLADQQTETDLMQQGEGFRREPGTVIRRSRKKDSEEAEASEAEETNQEEATETQESLPDQED